MSQVLVTGATGFIGGHTILALLDAGHTVRGTLRSMARKDALLATLSAGAGRPVTIDLVEADLSSDAGWESAVEGCEYVHHVASPLPNVLPKNHDDIIIPARDGALRVLRAAKAGGVRRVVMTSSMAAMAYGWGDSRPEPITEEHWSNPDNLEDNTAYTRSKTIAERAAWDYVAAEGEGLELTTINPCAVLGPVLSGDFSTSVEIVSLPMGGKLPAIPRVGFEIVDVRDVAAAHVLAMTHPDAASERFGLAGDFYWFADVAQTLRTRYPDRRLPKVTMPDWLLKAASILNPTLKQVIPELGKRRVSSSEKAKTVLGWQPRSSKQAILDCADSLIQHGVV